MVARASDPGKRPRGWTLHTLPADEAMLPETPQAGPAAILEASTDLCGRLLGARYDVKELLSHGERGAVYLAEDRNYGRTVALRLAAPQAALPGSEDVRALARRRMGVRHPHLAAVQGEGLTEGGLHYVAMEHVEGRNLIHMLGDPRLRWPAIQAIGVQVGEALVALHGAWVIHGDVHPGNLVWTADPERPVCIKLVDLDVGARAADSPYLPRGFYGERDSTCDVYALVASLYELCTGAVPEPTLAALAGHDELPEWFVQLLRTVLRTGSTPSARGLLASLRQGLPTAAVTSVPVAPAASEPAAQVVAHAPSGPRFVAHAPSGPLPEHAPSGPRFTPYMGSAAESVQQRAASGSRFAGPAAEPAASEPLFAIDAVQQHGSADPQPPQPGHAASESQQGLFVAPLAVPVAQSVPMPVVHSQSVPVPVVHSRSEASAAAATEDELWFAAVADFDPLQHLETITSEAAGRPESASLTGVAVVEVAPSPPEREVVSVADLGAPPPFEGSPEGEAPAMVTMRAFVDPRPSPVLGVPLAPVGPVDLEIPVDVEPPQPGALTREYEATAEILVNSRRRSRQVAVAVALVAVLLIVWRLFAREAVRPAEEEARVAPPVVPALDVKSAAPVKPAPVTPVAVPSPPVVAPPVTPEVAPEADATPTTEVAPVEEPAAPGELSDDELDAEPAPRGAPEQLGAGDFRQILLRANRSPATVKCYVQHTAGVEQKVEAVVRVSARGRVQKLKIDEGPLGDCLKQVVERLTFPRAQRSAQHQFVFRSPVQG